MSAPPTFAARIGQKIGSFVRGFRIGATGENWEGHERNRIRRRSVRRLESQDSGLNNGIREDLLSEARALEQTFPIVGGINRKYADHCISSCRVKWNTGVSKIDKLYSDAWKIWMLMCDRSGRLTFPKMTKLAIGRCINDGDIFAQLDRREGFLQLAGIEGDRVSSDGAYNSDLPRLVGGIGIDENGRKQFARVWERSLTGTFLSKQEIPFSQLVHIYDPTRFDAYRGVTHYHRVLNSLRTLQSTIRAESAAADLHSRLTLLVKTKSGGVNSAAPDIFDGVSQSTDGNGNEITVKSLNELAMVYMFPDEDMKAHTSDRPSDGWMKLMEWTVRETACGLHLPFGVVWHMAGLGSPAVRFEINQANRVFMSFLQDVVEPMWFRPIVIAWLSLEIKARRLPFHPNWFRFRTPRPKAITIDLGRDSKAGISENLAGLATASDWYAEDDDDFEEQTDQLVYEAKYREASRLGVPIETIKEVPLEQIRLVTANGNPEASKPAEDEEENEDADDAKKKASAGGGQ